MNLPNFVNFENTQYLDEMYQKFRQNPNSIDPNLRLFFEGFDLGYARVPQKPTQNSTTGATATSSVADLFRRYGHLSANLNPLQSAPDISQNQWLKTVPASTEKVRLQNIYCTSIGYEFDHCDKPDIKNWFIQKIESPTSIHVLSATQKKNILQKLTEAETFEQFVHTKYIGQKRFSAEGAETLLPMLHTMVETAAAQGSTHFVVGMAHRGRLNVLANLLKKPFEKIFADFEGRGLDAQYGDGDVKYHKGWGSKQSVTTVSGTRAEVNLSLLFNPSHLEFVNPVVLGDCYGKQRRLGDAQKQKVVPIIIHGDAAFSGQGIVSESLQMSKLKGYDVGGAIHLIIDNQVGFTANWESTHFTEYCTDLAKSIQGPILHVNGEDPEACAFVAQLAADFRQQFKQDIFIRLVCYRKYGHNEGDEPAFTQPLMYQLIKQKQSIKTMYEQKLVQLKVVGAEENKEFEKQYRTLLQNAQDLAKKQSKDYASDAFQNGWSGFGPATAKDLFQHKPLGNYNLLKIAEKIFTYPANFNPHPKLKKIMEDRLTATREGKGLDWGTAELLAFGALLDESVPVRLTGQDVQRGTFSHRHSVLHDYTNGSTYCGLNALSTPQAKFDIHNSLLSEEAVLGFEYGLSQDHPRQLVMWEGQFGDFANGAQVIIDQFLASGFTKWQRACGVVMLLPHGYEGQGPEHSSARLERFLQLSADLNWQVCNLSTPAQYFKALLNQVHRKIRVPLVVMSPKSLLRHPQAVSNIDDLIKTPFQTVIGDDSLNNESPSNRNKVERVLLCSGKIYYELAQMREQLVASGNKAAALPIVRLEQIYPFDNEAVLKQISAFKNVRELVWVQEEPQNQGAWQFIQSTILGDKAFSAYTLKYTGRRASSSPAVGNHHAHTHQQNELLKSAFGK